MRRYISIFIILAFLITTTAVYSTGTPGEASGDALGEASGKVILTTLAIAAVITIVIIAGGAATTTAITKGSDDKEKEKRQLAMLLNEATSNHGEKPNIETLSELYNLESNQIVNTISNLVSDGRINIKESLDNDNKAKETMIEINKALTKKSKEFNKYEDSKIKTVKFLVKERIKEMKVLTKKDVDFIREKILETN